LLGFSFEGFEGGCLLAALHLLIAVNDCYLETYAKTILGGLAGVWSQETTQLNLDRA